MRVAKMPYVYYDLDKQRYFVSLKKLVDVQSILGKDLFLHKFKQSLDREVAYELSIPIVRGWKAEIDRARMRIDEDGKFIDD